MNHIEWKLFDSSLYLLKFVKSWVRYVDDILCIWCGSLRQLNLFLSLINSLHSSINFTLELEENHAINFLDVTIAIQNQKLNFSIFRKPSYTDHVIPFNSNHHISHKLSAFHSLINRLVTIPLCKENYNKELHIIKLIASNNGYPTSLIDKLLSRKRRNLAINKIFHSPSDNGDSPKWFKLTFVNRLSQIIANHFPKNTLRPSFKTSLNLSKLFCNGKDKHEQLSKAGIYRLRCLDCDAVYLGQTSRCFSIRAKEHQRSFFNNNSNSHFAKHLLEANHSGNFIPEVLHICDKGPRLNFLEQLEILSHQNSPNFSVVNELLYPFHSPLLRPLLPPTDTVSLYPNSPP